MASPLATLAIVVWFAYAIAAFGLARLTAALGGSVFGASCAAALAVFNPWVYTESVAGHIGMITAYGAMAMLLGVARRRDRPFTIALLYVLTLEQLQIALIAALIAIVWSFRNKRFVPLLTVALTMVPMAIGYLGAQREFGATAFTVPWQLSQSIDPSRVLALSGYFTGYDHGFGMLAAIGGWAMITLALVGATGNRPARWVLCGALAAGVVATGLRGPIGFLYRVAIEQIPATAVYRELYDLVAFVAIGLIAVACSVRRTSSVGVLAALAVAYGVVWFQTPPTTFFAVSPLLQELPQRASSGSRIALYPAFVPMRLTHGTGSGADPDVHARVGAFVPLNAYSVAYPADAALASYELTGSATQLAALGVALAVNRPELSEDRVSAMATRALTPHIRDLAKDRIIAGSPLLSWLPELGRTSGVPALGSESIAFADEDRKDMIALRPSRDAVAADEGWVDLRLAFPDAPWLGEPFGGVMTTSRKPLTRPVGALEALVNVRGRLSGLVDSGATGDRYQWRRVSGDRLVCSGTCAVALFSRRQPPGDIVSSPIVVVPLEFRRPIPWLVRIQQIEQRGYLKFNERFSPGWKAFPPGRASMHLPLDGVANSWRVEPGGALMLYYAPAAGQFIASIVLLAWVVWCACCGLREALGKGQRSSRQIQPLP